MQRLFRIVFAFALTLSLPPAFADQAADNLARARKAVVRIQTDVGVGSGFVVRPSGVALTAWHVLCGSDWARAQFPDGRWVGVQGVLYANPAKDVAVIQLEGKEHPAISLADSDKAQTGEQINAIGHPGGGDQRVTSGVILRMRATPGIVKHLQITSPVHPGNSGGPVVNANGEAVGIVSDLVRGPQELYYAVAINEIGELPKADAPLQTISDALKTSAGSAEYSFIQGCMQLARPARSFAPRIPRVQLVRALGCFLQAVEKRKDFFEAHLNAGYTYLMLRQKPQAFAQFKEAMRICPDDITARQAVANAYTSMGQPVDAQREAKDLVRVSPEYAPAHRILGDLYVAEGRLADAETEFKTALRLLPAYGEAHVAVGRLYVKLRRGQEAVRALKKALVIQPEHAETHLWLGRAYELSGRHADALAALETAVAMNPENAVARYEEALEYIHLKRYTEAGDEYAVLKSISPEHARKLRSRLPRAYRKG